MSQSPFEPYLDVLEARLRYLPAPERAQWREEARQHLEEIASAAEELGVEPQEAMAAAIRKFGDAARLGGAMAQSMGCDPLTAGRAVVLFCGPLIVAMIALIGLAYAYVLSDSPMRFLALQLGGALAFGMAPICGGWRIGKHMRLGQPKLPVAIGLLGVGAISLPIAGVLLVPVLGTSVGSAAVNYCSMLLWFPIIMSSMFISRGMNLRSSSLARSRA